MWLILVPLGMIVASALAAAWVDARSLTARRRWLAWVLVLPAVLLAWNGLSLIREVAYDRVSFVSPEVAWAISIAAAMAVVATFLVVRLARLHAAWLLVALVPVGLAFASRDVPALLPAAVLLAAAVWPRSAAAGFARGEFGVVLGIVIAVLAVIASVPAGTALLLDATDGGEGSFARYSWSADVTPEGNSEFSLVVPFFASTESSRSLEEFKKTIRVVSGNGTVEVNDGMIFVQGSGPLRVAGTMEFQGPVRLREAFTKFDVPDVAFDIFGAPAAQVVWSADLSGGSGHSCWYRESRSVRVVEGEPTPFGQRAGVLCA